MAKTERVGLITGQGEGDGRMIESEVRVANGPFLTQAYCDNCKSYQPVHWYDLHPPDGVKFRCEITCATCLWIIAVVQEPVERG